MKQIVLLILLATSFTAQALTDSEKQACMRDYKALVVESVAIVEDIEMQLFENRKVGKAEEVMQLQLDLFEARSRRDYLQNLPNKVTDAVKFCEIVKNEK